MQQASFAEELTGLMKNGYYLEGFVRFTDVADVGDIVSIPYVGFRGEFQNLAVLEEPIYNLIADGKGGASTLNLLQHNQILLTSAITTQVLLQEVRS